MSKNLDNNKQLSFSTHLLKRFEEDIRHVHTQKSILEIVFKNLKDSWLAITLAHKMVKDEIEEEL